MRPRQKVQGWMVGCGPQCQVVEYFSTVPVGGQHGSGVTNCSTVSIFSRGDTGDLWSVVDGVKGVLATWVGMGGFLLLVKGGNSQ